MNRFSTFTCAAALLAASVSGAYAQFAGSNLVVSVVESGTTSAPTSASALVRLVAYNRQNGRPVTTTGQSYVLPTVLSGANHRLTQSGSATSEGELTLSSDGKYLMLVGYDTSVGTATVATTSATVVNRVVARVDWTLPQASAIDTTTALTNAYSGSNIRGAASPDGQTFFLSGNAGTSATVGGVAQVTIGSTTAVTNYGGTVTKNARDIGLFNGGLYVSGATGSGPLYGVGQVTPGTTTQLPGFPTAMGPSSYGFYFLNAVTLYVADDRTTSTTTTPTGGIQKWQNIGGTWTYQYTILIPVTTGTGFAGARQLAGSPFFAEDEGTTFAQLYAVTSDNRIVTVIDDNPGAQVETVDTGTTDKVFRGIEIIRPTGVTVGGLITLVGAVNFQIPVNIEFRELDTAGVPTGQNFTRTVTIAPDMTYTVTNVPAGKAYTIHIKAANYLAANHEINTFSQDDLDADVTLLPGDANNDNTVDIADFGLLVNSYGGDATAPGSGYDVRADFNNDQVVDIADFGSLVNSYGLSGEI